MNLSKATDEQLMNILRHDHSIPNDLLKIILEEAINRELLKGYIVYIIQKFFTDVRVIERKYNVTFEDFIQISYMAILRAADTFKPGDAGFTTCFVIPIQRKLMQFIRDNNAGKRTAELVSLQEEKFEDVPLEAMLPSAVNLEKQVIQKIYIEDLFNFLTDYEKKIVMLHMQGFTQREIADRFGEKRQRVHFFYHRSLKRMKERVS